MQPLSVDFQVDWSIDGLLSFNSAPGFSRVNEVLWTSSPLVSTAKRVCYEVGAIE